MKIIDLSKTIRDNPKAPFFLRVTLKANKRFMTKLMLRELGLPFRLMPKDFDG